MLVLKCIVEVVGVGVAGMAVVVREMANGLRTGNVLWCIYMTWIFI